MRLISKETTVNNKTYDPEVIVTLAISLQQMQDGRAYFNMDDYAKLIGTRVLDYIYDGEK
jgi:hypothetical protein